MKSIFLMTIAGFLVSTAAIADQAEKILGFQVGYKGITYRVLSGGCTDKTTFSFQVRESHPVQLVLVRKDRAMCEAVVHPVDVHFTWNEIPLEKGQQFFMANDIERLFRAY